MKTPTFLVGIPVGNIGKTKKMKGIMTKKKELEEIRKLLDSAENKIRHAKSKLFDQALEKKAEEIEESEEEDIIQGVFDGEKMLDNDKKEYDVPPNYASKSKLIVGDILKLSVAQDGKHTYKQIGPIDRKNVVGVLEEVTEGEFQADVEGKKYKLLLASVTYFKAKEGDKLSLTIPENDEVDWAAVDNVIN